MRVALISPLFPPYRGGVQTHVYNLSKELTALGHNVAVFTQHNDSTRTWWTPDGVEVHSSRIRAGGNIYPFSPRLWGKLARHLRSFDVVHAHNYHDLAALAAGFTHRQPFIFTPHYHGIGHTDFARRLHLVYRPLGQALFSRADQVICVSNAERLLVMDDYPAVASKTVVVSNGVTKRTTVPRSWADRDNLVVYAGRLEPYKRLDVVIAAMAELPADVRLLIIGTGSDKARLASSVIRLKLTDRITLAGALPDDAVASALAEARVVVTASQHEAFGLIILEARQAGARVVASALAAHREVAQLDPANGVSIWAPDTAVSGLAHAIRNALISHDPGAMSTAPRWSDVAAATEQVYQCALATPSMKSLSIAAQLGVG